MKARRAIGDGLRHRILKRDGFRCRYCGAHGSEVELQVDYVHPVSDGGSNHPWNLVTACRSCNAGKSDDLPEWSPCTVSVDEFGWITDSDLYIRNQYDETCFASHERIKHALGRERVGGFEDHEFWVRRLAEDHALYELWGRDGLGMQQCNPSGWGSWRDVMYRHLCSNGPLCGGDP